MYAPVPVTAAIGTVAAALAEQAHRRRLSLYAGAGLSAAEPANLPGASRLAELLVDALAHSVSLAGVPSNDLPAVADRVAAQPHGRRLLKEMLLRVADLLGAPFTYAHEVLALLLCEGAVTVLETNYDDCIERAAQPERIPIVISDLDRAEVDIAALLKVHGCATRPGTMLATTGELANPPLFASAEVAARLAVGTVAFIGIGSPADYVRSSLAAMAGRVGTEQLIVVGPQTANWHDSGWAAVLPTLPEEQRVNDTADHFCDELLRGYLSRFRAEVRQRVSAMPTEHPQRIGTEQVLTALESRDGVWVLRWLRRLAWRYRVGDPVAVAGPTVNVMLAVAALVGESSTRAGFGGLLAVSVELDGTTHAVPVVPLVCNTAPLGTQVAAEAHRRISDARSADMLPAGVDVVVVCSGHSGPLGPNEVEVIRGARLMDVVNAARASAASSLPENIVAAADAEHLIDFAGAGRVLLVAADRVVEAA